MRKHITSFSLLGVGLLVGALVTLFYLRELSERGDCFKSYNRVEELKHILAQLAPDNHNAKRTTVIYIENQLSALSYCATKFDTDNGRVSSYENEIEIARRAIDDAL